MCSYEMIATYYSFSCFSSSFSKVTAARSMCPTPKCHGFPLWKRSDNIEKPRYLACIIFKTDATPSLLE